ncbi:PREDICTED: protein disulfide isomerase-like 1-4 [Nicotiana attenuata]|uniref:Protein disulfide isomerase-like 1-4 n=1 Tax=Nicotiana attenuata TaxID=49451 RepID=A0A1J6I4L9_NICAT|nr:PREDICTED: protein disulfide isomerase-like 1-4 [Nicotiana attenuata]OIS99427.1 protein disulfide isomerase-like 1-4 [Nicotiana attenuata]
MASRLVIFLSISSLLLFPLFITPSLAKTPTSSDDDDEFLSFLEDYEESTEPDFENHDETEFPSAPFDHAEEDEDLKIDDKDVVVLTDRNFSEFVDDNKYVMVVFYAPWNGHCKALAPEYADAATELKMENVALAKVNAIKEYEVADNYDVRGFPTIFFFVDGDPEPYNGRKTKNAIVTWIKKKIGPGIYNIMTTEDAERVLTYEDKAVLAYLDSLVGPETDQLAAASKLEYDVNFYQTTNLNVAKLFNIESNAKRPALVMLKKEPENVVHYDGQFRKSAIAKFVSANKLPLVTTFTKESAPSIFASPIKKQVLLFATANDTDKLFPTFQDAAKLFKGKLNFVFVKMDDDEVGRPVSDYFGATGDAPQVIGYIEDENHQKFIFVGEITLEKIKAFGDDFLEDKLKPFYKSDPIPETNDADVKVVVGNNFDEIVLNESKDVLLEIYAPWCRPCQALEPTFNKLAYHFHGIESLVIAKMDGTRNEHPRAKVKGFPTLLFFPAGYKSIDPIPVDTELTLVALYKFTEKHATIPFKLQRPASSNKSESSASKASAGREPSNVKDEL